MLQEAAFGTSLVGKGDEADIIVRWVCELHHTRRQLADAWTFFVPQVVRFTDNSVDQLVMYKGFLEDMVAFAATSTAR